MGQYLVTFFTSEFELRLNLIIFRYEGTGRSLSLKLIEQLRVQSRPMGGSTKDKEADAKVLGRSLAEVTKESFFFNILLIIYISDYFE